MVLVLLAGVFGAAAFSAEIPAGQISAAADSLQTLEEDFARQSAPARLSMLCIGRFVDAQQAQSLRQSADETIERVSEILAEQKDYQSQMEGYPGRDWEARYGQTHLWSVCSRTVLRGEYLLAWCRFWQALCAPGERDKLLSEVIAACRAEEARWRGMEQILRALALWQRGGPTDEETLRVALHQMMVRSDLTDQAMEEMLLLQRRFELFGEGPFAEHLADLFEGKLAAQQDFEWALEYAFLEFGRGDGRPVERVLGAWPQAKGFVSVLLLEACADRFAEAGPEVVSKWNPLIVSVLCEAISESRQPEQYKLLLAELAKRHATAAVLRARAKTLESSDPERAIEVLLEAARLARQQPEDSLPAAKETAEGAARLAVRLYRENAGRYGGVALRALREYIDLAGAGADPEVVYEAVGILAEQGLGDQSRQLLDLLAARQGEYAARAQLEVFRISARQAPDPSRRREIEDRWQAWIQSLETEAEETAGLRRQAAVEYVQHLFAAPSRENAERVVQFLGSEATAGDATLTYLYVQALALLDRFGPAVIALNTIETNCRNAGFDLYVLEGFAERLEEYTYLSSTLIEPPAGKLEALRRCFEAGRDRDRADLLWAEMAARLPEREVAVGNAIDAILSRFESSPSAGVVRCRAFRRMQQGRWAEAAGDWQAVRGAYEPQDRTEKGRNWHWWRAKYYELLCYSRVPEDTAEDVAHAVRILLVLYDAPPAVWEEKLKALAENQK